MRITPADVGARVSLRRRVTGPPRLSDVVGELTGWSDGVLTVRTRRHGDVSVPAEDLVAAKVVPPAPPPRRAGSPFARPAAGVGDSDRRAPDVGGDA